MYAVKMTAFFDFFDAFFLAELLVCVDRIGNTAPRLNTNKRSAGNCPNKEEWDLLKLNLNLLVGGLVAQDYTA